MNRRKLLGLLVASPFAAIIPAPVMASGGFVSRNRQMIVGEAASEFFVERSRIDVKGVKSISIQLRPEYLTNNPRLP